MMLGGLCDMHCGALHGIPNAKYERESEISSASCCEIVQQAETGRKSNLVV